MDGEDAKDAANRALLFAAPSPRSGSRSLSSSASAVPAMSPLSLSSSSVPTSSPGSGRRDNEAGSLANSGITSRSDRSEASKSETSRTEAGPAKWSQRHQHHHLPPSAAPSPSLSPILDRRRESNPATTITPSNTANINNTNISNASNPSNNSINTNAANPSNAGNRSSNKEQGKEHRRSSSANLIADYGGEDTIRMKLSQLKDKRKKSSYNAQADQMLTGSMEDLNITSKADQFDLNGLESFLKESQEDHAVKEALMQGVELKEYGQKVEGELKETENAIVPVYISLRNDIGDLHTKVGGCVEILSAFEKLLTSFQADLSNISDDIKNMQDQSMEKNIKINNRKAIISKLDRFIEDVSLPPAYVEQLEKGHIDMAYLQLLASFNRKMGFVSMQRTKGVVAVEDMYRKFTVVLDRVVARVHKFVVGQTASIRSFAQLRETQEELSSMSFLYQFLFIHAPDNARDVKAAYMDACDKFYSNYYKSYVTTMSKYLVDVATKNDVIGVEDSKLRGFFSSKLPKSSTKGSVFALGTRGTLLEQLEAAPIDATTTTAATTQPKYSYDELFRTYLKLLVDQVNCEFFFVRDFFLSDDDVTFGIFLRSADMLVENVENYTATSFDAVGLLVVLCIIDRFTELIPGNLEYLITALQKATNVVFTRFVFVFEMNVVSIRTANPQDLGPIDIRTHYVTRRYAEFAASILTLYGTLPDQLRDGIASCMTKLRDAMLKLLQQLSHELKDKKDQTVFLINNYDLILSLVRTRGVNAEDVAEFTSALTRAENNFVQLQLTSFSQVAQITNFVDELGPIVNAPGSNADDINHPKYNKEVIEGLLRQFSGSWKAGVAGWSADIPKLFTNFKIGVQLFKMLADQMFSYYKQFSNLMGKSTNFKMLKTSKYFVTENEIIHELRKYDMDI